MIYSKKMLAQEDSRVFRQGWETMALKFWHRDPQGGQRVEPQLQVRPIGFGQRNNPAQQEQGTDQPWTRGIQLEHNPLQSLIRKETLNKGK